MGLTDVAERSAKLREKHCKSADRAGLHLLVTLACGKPWRLKYRMHGAEKRLALGSDPEASLSEARKARDAAREVPAVARPRRSSRGAQRIAARVALGANGRAFVPLRPSQVISPAARRVQEDKTPM
jgi:hypothetical protein